MRSEEQKAIEAAAVLLNNAVVEVHSRKSSVDGAQRRLEEAKRDVEKAREALLKLMNVGRNVPMKSVRLPDSLCSIVVTFHRSSETDKGSPIVYLSHPDGSEIV